MCVSIAQAAEKANEFPADGGSVELAVLTTAEFKPSMAAEAELEVRANLKERNRSRLTNPPPPSSAPGAQRVQSALHGADWGAHHTAVDSLRRLAIHHPAVLAPHL